MTITITICIIIRILLLSYYYNHHIMPIFPLFSIVTGAVVHLPWAFIENIFSVAYSLSVINCRQTGHTLIWRSTRSGWCILHSCNSSIKCFLAFGYFTGNLRADHKISRVSQGQSSSAFRLERIRVRFYVPTLFINQTSLCSPIWTTR